MENIEKLESVKSIVETNLKKGLITNNQRSHVKRVFTGILQIFTVYLPDEKST